MLVIGALALFLSAFTGVAGANPPERDGTIHQDLPISGDSFQSESDCGPITSGMAWHFILNPTTAETAGSTLTATFEGGITRTATATKAENGATHYWVGTDDGAVLTGASVDIGVGKLQLSHVCDADDGEEAPDGPTTCPAGQVLGDHDDDPDTADQCMPEETVEPCPDGEMLGDHDDDAGTPDQCMAEETDGEGTEKVTICHATGSETNPYVLITISVNGVLNGHEGEWHQNGEDIIPAFDGFAGQPVGQGPVTAEDCPPGDTGGGETTPTMVDLVAAAECPEGASVAVVSFGGSTDVDTGDATVTAVDGDDDDVFYEETISFVDGELSGSFDFPGADVLDGDLVVSIVFGDFEDSVTVAPITCGDAGGGEETPIFTPIPVVPPIEVDDDVEEPAETPDVDVEDEVVVNVPPTVRPVVTPANPTVPAQPVVLPTVVDRTPAVMGDVVTRSAASGQLPRTGNDAASTLAPFGAALLLAGFALQRTGRKVRRTAS